MGKNDTIREKRVPTDSFSDHELTAAIIEAIAEEQNESLSDIDLQLLKVVDLDALETLYRHAREHDESNWKISFPVDEFDVRVESDGSIAVTGPGESSGTGNSPR